MDSEKANLFSRKAEDAWEPASIPGKDYGDTWRHSIPYGVMRLAGLWLLFILFLIASWELDRRGYILASRLFMLHIVATFWYMLVSL